MSSTIDIMSSSMYTFNATDVCSKIHQIREATCGLYLLFCRYWNYPFRRLADETDISQAVLLVEFLYFAIAVCSGHNRLRWFLGSKYFRSNS